MYGISSEFSGTMQPLLYLVCLLKTTNSECDSILTILIYRKINKITINLNLKHQGICRPIPPGGEWGGRAANMYEKLEPYFSGNEIKKDLLKYYILGKDDTVRGCLLFTGH